MFWPDLKPNQDNPEFAAFIPGLPPSLNTLRTIRNRHPILTAKGRKYKATAHNWITYYLDKHIPHLTSEDPLRLDFIFYFKNIENKGWKTGRASRFKKKDTSNLIKLVEDVLMNCLEIDDCQIVKSSQRKLQSSMDGVLICLSKTTME